MSNRSARIEIYRDQSEEEGFRWRCVAGNGEITSSGEAYESWNDARRGARGAMLNLAEAVANERIVLVGFRDQQEEQQDG